MTPSDIPLRTPIATCAPGAWRAALTALLLAGTATAQLAVHAKLVLPVSGTPLHDGLVLIEGRTIKALGPAASIQVPAGWNVLEAEVVTPGLIDAHSVVGLTGWLNYAHDQEQLEKSAPMQPELRALDAYDAREPLIAHLRSLGITTVHSGHAPGALISGQTLVAKLHGQTVAEAVIVPEAMLACTLGEGAVWGEGKSPGTRSKAVALLRQELVKAQEYARKLELADVEKRPARDLHLEELAALLKGERPLLVTAQRARDIDAALRLAAEFKIELVLDGAAECYLMLDAIKTAGVPVLLHPTMARSEGDLENLSMESAARLHAAGIPFALQSGYEGYVPKTRVVLFEAAIACKQGLAREAALEAITLSPARILGLENRIGSIEVGKDADLALWDGDPFEYVTHCTGVIIDGKIESSERK